MEKIIFVDTNFLISIIGNIKEFINKIKEAGYSLYITKTVKNEFINIELRKRKEIYNKLEKIKKSNKFLKISYVKEDDALKSLENTYNKLFDKYFENKIIEYDKTDMLDRVLERNKFKMPPFYNEQNSTDKGFKDTIIFLTIKDYIQTLSDDVEIYFVTADNGFIKYKEEIEQEIFDETRKNIKIIDARSKEIVYSYLNIESENEDKQEENIFIKSKDKIDIDKIREEINELMFEFKYETIRDYYGNEDIVKRFELFSKLNYTDIEIFLDAIEINIKKHIFNKHVSVDELFRRDFRVDGIHGINVETLQKIYNLYIEVKETEYKDAFINFIMQNVNENLISSVNYNSTNDDLPF